MSRRVISNPSLPALMRGGAFSSGVEAPAGRTIYVSDQVSVKTIYYIRFPNLPRTLEFRRRGPARNGVPVVA